MFTYEKLGDGFVYYKNIYSDPYEIIKKIDKLQDALSEEISLGTYAKDRDAWEDWSHEGDNGETLIFCKKSWLPSPDNLDQDDKFYSQKLEISKALFSGLEDAYNHYSRTLYRHAGRNIKGKVEQISILKYEKSGYLPEHIDQGISSRVLSVVAYLNDDYDGGEITFPCVGDSGITIKPEAGSAVFFPSNYVGSHTISEVTRGTRYAVPNWYHNRIDKIESDGSV